MRPIDADALEIELRNIPGGYSQSFAGKACLMMIDEAPTLDYAQRQQWISVKDGLPEKKWEINPRWFSEVVLAATGESVLYGCFLVNKINGTWEFASYDANFDFVRCVTVTHWMQLPELPKEE